MGSRLLIWWTIKKIRWCSSLRLIRNNLSALILFRHWIRCTCSLKMETKFPVLRTWISPLLMDTFLSPKIKSKNFPLPFLSRKLRTTWKNSSTSPWLLLLNKQTLDFNLELHITKLWNLRTPEFSLLSFNLKKNILSAFTPTTLKLRTKSILKWWCQIKTNGLKSTLSILSPSIELQMFCNSKMCPKNYVRLRVLRNVQFS